MEGNEEGTYQHTKGNDLQHTFHGKHGCKHNIQAFQHFFVCFWSIIELKRDGEKALVGDH